MTRDWWDTPPTKIHILFNADQIHADLDTAWNTPRIQLDDGQTRVTLHPADQTALVELHNLTGILLDSARHTASPSPPCSSPPADDAGR
jgi:hypothetical protein